MCSNVQWIQTCETIFCMVTKCLLNQVFAGKFMRKKTNEILGQIKVMFSFSVYCSKKCAPSRNSTTSRWKQNGDSISAESRKVFSIEYFLRIQWSLYTLGLFYGHFHLGGFDIRWNLPNKMINGFLLRHYWYKKYRQF